MSRDTLANAYDSLAEAYAQVAHELRGHIETPAEGVSDSGHAAPTGAAGVSPSSVAPTSPLSVCPKHRVAWTVKEGGISKNGKPYKAFWKCSERDEDGYCNEKPDRSWAATHSAERAMVDEMPF